MKITQLIQKLEKFENKFGDLEVEDSERFRENPPAVKLHYFEYPEHTGRSGVCCIEFD